MISIVTCMQFTSTCRVLLVYRYMLFTSTSLQVRVVYRYSLVQNSWLCTKHMTSSKQTQCMLLVPLFTP